MKNIPLFLATAGLSAAMTLSSQAAVLSFQDFENEATPGGFYASNDTTDRPLADDGTANVVSVGLGGQLGFTASFSDSRSDNGLANDLLGVVTSAQIAGSDIDVFELPSEFTTGTNQAYGAMDVDGLLTFRTSTVELSNAENVVFSFDFAFGDAGWESTDNALIAIVTNEGTTNLVDFTGASGLDILDTGSPQDYQGNATPVGQLNTVTFSIPDSATSAYLEIQFNSNSSQEALIFDNIAFNGDSLIPEPSSSLLLLGSAALLFGRRRK